MLRGFKLCVVGSWLALVSLAMAQDSRPLRLVVPYPSGGILDMQARLIAPALRQQLQREVFIDNVAGAAGAIGLQHVLSAPEGSELVLGTDSDVVLAPLFNTECATARTSFGCSQSWAALRWRWLHAPASIAAHWTV
jgi:tripartite-type tricarboxylate transporter receptor subunit TctC